MKVLVAVSGIWLGGTSAPLAKYLKRGDNGHVMGVGWGLRVDTTSLIPIPHPPKGGKGLVHIERFLGLVSEF